MSRESVRAAAPPPRSRILGQARRPTPEERAVMEILEAACGYARMEGRHVCKATYRVDQGCDPVPWQGLAAAVEEAVRMLVAAVEQDG